MAIAAEEVRDFRKCPGRINYPECEENGVEHAVCGVGSAITGFPFCVKSYHCEICVKQGEADADNPYVQHHVWNFLHVHIWDPNNKIPGAYAGLPVSASFHKIVTTPGVTAKVARGVILEAVKRGQITAEKGFAMADAEGVTDD